MGIPIHAFATIIRITTGHIERRPTCAGPATFPDATVNTYRAKSRTMIACRILSLYSMGVSICFPQQPLSPSTNPPNAKPTKQCEISGRVVSAATGESLTKTTLYLRKAVSAPNPAGDLHVESRVAAGTDGSFVFTSVEPGKYELAAERTGYVRGYYGARNPSARGSLLTLSPGGRLNGLLVKLTPQATIGGSIFEEDGEPVKGAQVRLLRYANSPRGRRLWPASSATAGVDGSFILGNLAPGSYYLSVSPQVLNSHLPAQPGKRQEGYRTTYFPNTPDPESAAPIVITAGAQIRGIDVRLTRVPVFRVRGAAIDASTGVPANNVVLMLMPADSLNLMNNVANRSFATVTNGSFEFSGVPPGTYEIRTDIHTISPLFGRSTVAVRDEDVEGIRLTLAPRAKLTLKVAVAKSDRPSAGTVDLSGVSLSLMAAEGFPSVPVVGRTDMYTFQATDMPLENFQLNVSGLPERIFVKSIRFAGREVTNSVLDLTFGGGVVDILISHGAGRLTGEARNEQGDTVSGALVTAWFPGQTQAGSFNSVRTTSTDQNGTFTLDNLTPGEYHLLAWEDVDPTIAGDPKFLSRFEGEAVTVILREHAEDQKELKVVSKQRSEAELAKLSQ